jgi:hypothetical protein
MAPDIPASEMEKIGTVVARSLAFLCLQNTSAKNGTLLEKAQLLRGLGLSPGDVAGMLGTTVDSLGALARQAKNSKGKKRGKEAKAKDKTRNKRGTR